MQSCSFTFFEIASKACEWNRVYYDSSYNFGYTHMPIKISRKNDFVCKIRRKN